MLGVRPLAAIKGEEEEKDDEVWCPTCFKTFPSHQAQASHRARAHGWRNEAWSFADSATCKVCNVCFWTRGRLVDHWKGAQGSLCLEAIKTMQDAGDPHENAKKHRSEAKDNERLQFCPATRLSGAQVVGADALRG